MPAIWLMMGIASCRGSGEVLALTVRVLITAAWSIELVPVAVILNTELWVLLMVASWLAIWLIRLLAPCIVMVVVSSLLIRASWPAAWRIELVPVTIIEISEGFSTVASTPAIWLIRLLAPFSRYGEVLSLTIRALLPAAWSIELVPVSVILNTELWFLLFPYTTLFRSLIRLLAPCIVMVVVSSLLIRVSWPAAWRI